VVTGIPYDYGTSLAQARMRIKGGIRAVMLVLDFDLESCVLGLGIEAKIMSLENWLNLFPIMICFSSVQICGYIHIHIHIKFKTRVKNSKSKQ